LTILAVPALVVVPGWWILPWSLLAAEGAEMLVELRVAELRYRAVWEVLADYQTAYQSARMVVVNGERA
jgi:hypothetical protein